MKYWSIAYPGGNGEDVVETLSEDEIIEYYYPHWEKKMIEKYGQEEFDKTWSKKECLEDWVITHWAWEATE
jgi:hypothetical protein